MGCDFHKMGTKRRCPFAFFWCSYGYGRYDVFDVMLIHMSNPWALHGHDSLHFAPCDGVCMMVKLAALDLASIRRWNTDSSRSRRRAAANGSRRGPAHRAYVTAPRASIGRPPVPPRNKWLVPLPIVLTLVFPLGHVAAVAEL